MRTCHAHIFPDGAKCAADPYRRTCGIISENPLVGRPVEEIEGVREFSTPRTPFSFIYRIVEDRIEVLRAWEQQSTNVFHGHPEGSPTA